MKPKHSTLSRISPETNKPSRLSFRRGCLLSIGAINLFASQTVEAARTWDGGDGSNVWATGSSSKKNWDGDSSYIAGEDVICTGTTQTGPTIGVTNLAVGSITFTSAGQFTIGGSAILTINGGVVNNDDSLQSFSVSTIALGASQTWNAGTLSGGGLAFTGTSLNLGASQTLTIDGANDTSISNLINGTSTSGIVKTGTGVLTLSGANTYTGITSVNDGTLIVNGTQSGATGAMNVASIAKLFGTGTIGGATTILGTQSSGSSSGAVGIQNFSSSLKYDTGSIFEWDINVAGLSETHDRVVAGSLLGSGAVFKIVGSGDGYATAFWDSNRNWTATDLFGVNTNLATIFSSATTATNFNPSPSQGYFSFTDVSGGTKNQLTWTAVPEPTTALAGILLAAGLLRRRRQSA